MQIKEKVLTAVVGALLVILVLCRPAFALEQDEIMAEAAILIDAQSGQVLFEKNRDKQVYPASTTKVLTAMLALEYLSSSDMITVSQNAVDATDRSGSHVALMPGETFRVADAIYAMMLPSANDAATVLAEAVSGSEEAFAQLMNQRAKEIGANNSSFINPHGMHDSHHYTTAYDMAVITRKAIENQEFVDFFGTQRHTMPATNLQKAQRPFTNYQYMLLPDQWVYNPDVIGGKVGYTMEARHTMTTAATKDGRTLIAVVMSTEFYDTQALFDFGFDEFASYEIPAEQFPVVKVPILQEGHQLGSASFSLSTGAQVLLHETTAPSQIQVELIYPESFGIEDDYVAYAAISAPSAAYGVPSLLLEQIPLEAEIEWNLVAASGAMEEEKNSPSLFTWLLVAGVAFIGLFLLFFLTVAFRQYTLQKRRRRRMERLRHRMRQYPGGKQPDRYVS